MTLEETKQKLHQAVIKSSGDSFKLLDQLLTAKAFRSFGVLQARYSKYLQERNKGTKGSNDLDVEFNNIVNGLIESIDTLTTDDLIAGADVLEKEYVKLLLVCSEARKSYVKEQLFPDRYFPNAVLVDQTASVSKQAAEVVLYDAASFPDRDVLLKAYLDEHLAYLLWLGPPKQLLRDYPDKAYFSNSPFSVYARLREMLDYIKYFQPKE